MPEVPEERLGIWPESAPIDRAVQAVNETPIESPLVPVAEGETDLAHVKGRWGDVLEALRQMRNKPLEALLRDAEPTSVESGNVVVLAFKFPFHASKVQEPANVVSVNRAVSRALGVRATVRCEVAGGASGRPDRQRAQAAPDDPVVSKALRVLNARLMTPAELAALEALPIVAEFESTDL